MRGVLGTFFVVLPAIVALAVFGGGVRVGVSAFEWFGILMWALPVYAAAVSWVVLYKGSGFRTWLRDAGAAPGGGGGLPGHVKWVVYLANLQFWLLFSFSSALPDVVDARYSVSVVIILMGVGGVVPCWVVYDFNRSYVRLGGDGGDSRARCLEKIIQNSVSMVVVFWVYFFLVLRCSLSCAFEERLVIGLWFIVALLGMVIFFVGGDVGGLGVAVLVGLVLVVFFRRWEEGVALFVQYVRGRRSAGAFLGLWGGVSLMACDYGFLYEDVVFSAPGDVLGDVGGGVLTWFVIVAVFWDSRLRFWDLSRYLVPGGRAKWDVGGMVDRHVVRAEGLCILVALGVLSVIYNVGSFLLFLLERSG